MQFYVIKLSNFENGMSGILTYLALSSSAYAFKKIFLNRSFKSIFVRINIKSIFSFYIILFYLLFIISLQLFTLIGCSVFGLLWITTYFNLGGKTSIL